MVHGLAQSSSKIPYYLLYGSTFEGLKMDPRREIMMRIILDIVDNIRRVKKKRLQRGRVLGEAEMIGLDTDEARDAILSSAK